jgi:putative transposase
MLPPYLYSTLIHENRYNLWKPRFDDLVVWSGKQFKIKTEYIHNNPVKAGLVRDATEYEYSSARYWLLGEPGPIPIDKEWKWTKE